MAEERKLDLIRVVAAIMESFVDRAFGVAPEQILLGTSVVRLAFGTSNALDSTHHINSTFNDAANKGAVEESDS